LTLIPVCLERNPTPRRRHDLRATHTITVSRGGNDQTYTSLDGAVKWSADKSFLFDEKYYSEKRYMSSIINQAVGGTRKSLKPNCERTRLLSRNLCILEAIKRWML